MPGFRWQIAGSLAKQLLELHQRLAIEVRNPKLEIRNNSNSNPKGDDFESKAGPPATKRVQCLFAKEFYFEASNLLRISIFGVSNFFHFSLVDSVAVLLKSQRPAKTNVPCQEDIWSAPKEETFQ